MSTEAHRGRASATLERRRPTRQRGDRARRAVWVIYGLLAACLLAYVVSEIVRRDGKSWPAIDDWGVVGFEFIATGLCLARAFVSRRRRAIVLLLGLGLLAWTAGDLALTIESLGGREPSTPSLADAFYLVFYPATYIGLMLYVRREVSIFGVAVWLDGAIAGLGAAAVCAAFAFEGVLHTAGGSTITVATNLAYPIGDLLLLALVVGGSAVLPSRRRAPWLLLAVGLALNVVGDTSNLFQSSFGASHVGTAFDAIAWPTYILFVSAAMWLRPAPVDSQLRQRPPGFLLPALATTAALVILFVGSLHHITIAALALAAATLVVAAIRSGLSVVSLRALTEERHRNSVTDQLTGLANRRALFELLDKLLPHDPEPDVPLPGLAFLYIDLDGFKQVNDSFGHSTGDALLRQLGARLGGSLRIEDLLVRLGGDEFAVVLVDTEADYGAMVAQRLVARLEEPFLLDGVRARISASIGIAVAPADAASAADLLHCADLAMYRAKQSGSSFAIYQEDLDGEGDRLRLAEELRVAIERRQLELHYQPQIELSTGRVVAVEALLRWRHPRLGQVPPLAFLSLAEESDLMRPLTRFVLEDALSQCARWHAAGDRVTVSVNVSPTDLVDPSFTEVVAEALERNHLPPGALVVEVTETSPISDLDRSKQAIERLSQAGVVVSVDDFGAGFTSLAYLGSLAVSELKLDRSFITELTTARAGRDVTLVRSTIELAHSLGLRVVAEGVEDDVSLDLLTTLGCDLAQGFLIGRPVPADELVFGSSGPPPDSSAVIVDM
jgi:diguanylate cyclase